MPYVITVISNVTLQLRYHAEALLKIVGGTTASCGGAAAGPECSTTSRCPDWGHGETLNPLTEKEDVKACDSVSLLVFI